MSNPWFLAARTLVIGAAGGFLLTALSFPLAWLAGPMALVAIAAVAGVPVGIPMRLRAFSFVLLGIAVGEAVEPEAVAQLGHWIPSLLLLALAVPLICVVGMLVVRRLSGCSVASGFYASTPGSLTTSVIMAEEAKADIPLVVLIQSARLVLLTLSFPLLIESLLPGQARGIGAPVAANEAWITAEQTALIATATAGGLLGKWIGLPVPMLMMPMFVSGLMNGLGWIDAPLPPWLLSFGLLVLGMSFGIRFTGVDVSLLRRIGIAGVGSIIATTLITVVFAFVVYEWLGVSFVAALLAFAPGGLETMTLIAVAFGIDPAFVGTHHFARMFAMTAILPWTGPAVRWLARRMGERENQSPTEDLK